MVVARLGIWRGGPLEHRLRGGGPDLGVLVDVGDQRVAVHLRAGGAIRAGPIELRRLCTGWIATTAGVHISDKRRAPRQSHQQEGGNLQAWLGEAARQRR